MAEYMVQDASLETVADAIRAKGGTSAALSFPNGFAQAIAAIERGSQVASGTITPTTTSRSISLSVDFLPTVFVAVNTATTYSNGLKTIFIIDGKQYYCTVAYASTTGEYTYDYYTNSSSGITYANGMATITASPNFTRSSYKWLAVA